MSWSAGNKPFPSKKPEPRLGCSVSPLRSSELWVSGDPVAGGDQEIWTASYGDAVLRVGEAVASEEEEDGESVEVEVEAEPLALWMASTRIWAKGSCALWSAGWSGRGRRI
jgi:hypothetical protein